MDRTEAARRFAIEAHGDQRYDDLPYEHHLTAVVTVLKDFNCSEAAQTAGWLHDVIEDTAFGYDAVEARFGREVADMVMACTGEGETRPERNAAIYRKIAACPAAAVVKAADRIANVEAAAPESKHMARYRGERDGFRAAIEPHVPRAMWARLERALGA